MKTIASRSLLVVLCVGSGVLSLGFGSCGSTSSSGSAAMTDAGGFDTGIPTDSAVSADTGNVFVDAGAFDTGSVEPDGGDGGAGSCGEPETMLGGTCDGCLQTNCEPAWCACVAGEPDPDAGDAGSGCLQYVQCVETCVEGDAGSPTDCLTKVCAVAPFTTPQQQAGHAFLDCLVQYCGSDCGQ